MHKYSLKSDATIRETLQKMDELAVKTLYVINHSNQLIGSISDGDIRRAILKEVQLQNPVNNVMNPKPHFLFENDYNIDDVKRILLTNKFESIPVVNDEKIIIQILFWDSVFSEAKEELPALNMPVVIMAGGKGTRMKPFTNILPKPLIPMGDRSILEVIMNEYKKYGINDFYITVNYKKNLIKAYFEEEDKNYNITYIEENKPLGTAGALKLIEKRITTPFFVSNCDILIKGRYHEMVDFHIKGKYELTIIGSMQFFQIPYGVCKIKDGGDLDEIIEKPSYDLLVNTGMYILNPGILKFIPGNTLYHITHLMADLKNMGMRIGVYPVSEKSWIDVGQWDEYKRFLE